MEAFRKGSNGALVNWWRTRDRFQEGTPCLPLGLSLWKLSRRRVRFSSLLMFSSTLATISAIAVLLPPMVLDCRFLSLKRCKKKIRNLVHRGRLTPLNKNGPLWLVHSSSWDSLRSLNSFCHLIRETLFVDGRGSMSQACRFRLPRFLWTSTLNGWVTRSFTNGRVKGIWTDKLTRSQNQGMFGQPGAMRIILRQPWSIILATTWGTRETGGKAYTSKFPHGRLRASTAQAVGSGTGDTILRKLVIEPRCKQVYLWLGPSGTQKIEHLLR